jgi:peptidoglycan hydrolase CwlO-like protein
MKNKILSSLCLIVFIFTAGYCYSQDCKELKAKLDEAESTLFLFAESLANCSEELEACHKQKVLVTDKKKELISKIREKLAERKELNFLMKLTEEELESLENAIIERLLKNK